MLFQVENLNYRYIFNQLPILTKFLVFRKILAVFFLKVNIQQMHLKFYPALNQTRGEVD